MKYITLIILILVLASCTTTLSNKTWNQRVKEADLSRVSEYRSVDEADENVYITLEDIKLLLKSL
jgi:ATP/ADP translocase